MSEITLIKESGEPQAFDRGKVIRSLMSSGVPERTALDVLDRVLPRVRTGMSTRQVYRMAKLALRACDPTSRMRYSIKEAVYELGPSGYPFERYVGGLLKAEGYETRVGVMVRGRCIEHEVDVVATRGGETLYVECKFHGNGTLLSSVKTALYVDARMKDLAQGLGGEGLVRGMLVTNTRLSGEAIRYAECSGLGVMAWKYPKDGGLERLIDRHRAYPVTVMSAVTKKVLALMAGADLMLVPQVARMDVGALMSRAGLDHQTAVKVLSQAQGLCG